MTPPPLPSAVDGPEAAYSARVSRAHRKAWGQFFTPDPIADLMADWIAQVGPAEVCDPAAGTGALTRAVLRRLPGTPVRAIEKDPELAATLRAQAARDVTVETADYLKAEASRTPAFIVNPPYIRHRHLAGYASDRDRLNRTSQAAIPKMANLYIYFCVKLLADLEPGGRAAVLLPAEWMNANFATPFKAHLLDSGALKEIVAFSDDLEMFDDALTTASLLFLERPR